MSDKYKTNYNYEQKNILIIVNEFFGEWNSGRGGYGFLARNILPYALNVPKDKITVCMGRSRSLFRKEVMYSKDGIKLIKLPKIRYFAAKVVNSYDLAISIEATVDYVFSLLGRLRVPIIFWVQDPRPSDDWKEIESVKLAQEQSYWNSKTYELVNRCYKLGKIKFVTQANCLRGKAINLYKLSTDINMPFLPNPLDINEDITGEKSTIIFLGRLDSVKRGWLFCEIARRMPEYDFCVMGASTNEMESDKNKILEQYYDLPNLRFLGHLDGDNKAQELRKAKILVNTSIHEALPVSFLEAFAYGVTVVSNQNPDNLVGRFGRYTGKSIGDGWGDVDKFVKNIDYLMKHEEERRRLAEQAKLYVSTVHSFENFRKIFWENVKF